MPTNTSGRGGDRRSGKTYPPNDLSYWLRCQWCGDHSWHARPDARYCSQKCKKASSRAKLLQARILAAEAAARRPAARKPKRKKQAGHG
jgi:hypothetical protein